MRKEMTMKGMVVAGAVAALLSAGVASAAGHVSDAPKTVKCQGANECKGKSACKTADSGCKGQNGCKGKGWIEVKDDAECKAKGGTVVK